jgi:hypothetical protein
MPFVGSDFNHTGDKDLLLPVFLVQHPKKGPEGVVCF